MTSNEKAMMKVRVAELGIVMRFRDRGEYWLTNGYGHIPLGKCKSGVELAREILRAVEAGSGEERWVGWETQQ
jgi:hypothetical protein